MPSKNVRAFMKDLKQVYRAVNETMASQALQSLDDNWGDKYPIVIQSWQNNWDFIKNIFIISSLFIC
nr:transposase [Clostridium sp. JN-1]